FAPCGPAQTPPASNWRLICRPGAAGQKRVASLPCAISPSSFALRAPESEFRRRPACQLEKPPCEVVFLRLHGLGMGIVCAHRPIGAHGRICDISSRRARRGLLSRVAAVGALLEAR